MKKNYLVTYAYIADNGQLGAIKVALDGRLHWMV